MTTKQNYLRALMQQPAAWVLRSAQQPNVYMTRVDVLLHYVALRKMGVLSK